jgi:hypothetical protein
MIEGFEALSTDEFEALKSGVSWITILIAGADGKIDMHEKEWAEKITKIRSYSLEGEMNNFYTQVGLDFSNRLNALIEELPDDTEARKSILTERLSSLNSIMLKLDNAVGADLYDSFLSFAKHVAKSSGGFLGMMSISSAEKALVGLDMLNKIEYIPE